MADWGDGVSASCTVPISCHFRDCKTLLVTSLTRVSGAIASVQTFYLYTLSTVIQRRQLLVWCDLAEVARGLLGVPAAGGDTDGGLWCCIDLIVVS